MNEFSDPLQVIFTSGKYKADVTAGNLFLGYKDVLIGIVISNEVNLKELSNAELKFIEKKTGFTVANLALELDHIHPTTKNKLLIYKCRFGSHKFINPLQRYILKLRQSSKKKKMGNVDLPGNLYEQVKIAYSVPRKICLVTCGDNGLYNLFPTDLHGMIDNENYVISLRISGKANEQVNKFRNICLSTMNINMYKYVYSLGKNHMREPAAKDAFVFSGQNSEKFTLPLPEGCIEYKELQLIDSVKAGIHNLNYFKIINTRQLNKKVEPVLSHIHRDYLAWLFKNGYKVNYLLR